MDETHSSIDAKLDEILKNQKAHRAWLVSCFAVSFLVMMFLVQAFFTF